MTLYVNHEWPSLVTWWLNLYHLQKAYKDFQSKTLKEEFFSHSFNSFCTKLSHPFSYSLFNRAQDKSWKKPSHCSFSISSLHFYLTTLKQAHTELFAFYLVLYIYLIAAQNKTSHAEQTNRDILPSECFIFKCLSTFLLIMLLWFVISDWYRSLILSQEAYYSIQSILKPAWYTEAGKRFLILHAYMHDRSLYWPT